MYCFWRNKPKGRSSSGCGITDVAWSDWEYTMVDLFKQTKNIIAWNLIDLQWQSVWRLSDKREKGNVNLDCLSEELYIWIGASTNNEEFYSLVVLRLPSSYNPASAGQEVIQSLLNPFCHKLNKVKPMGASAVSSFLRSTVVLVVTRTTVQRKVAILCWK